MHSYYKRLLFVILVIIRSNFWPSQFRFIKIKRILLLTIKHLDRTQVIPTYKGPLHIRFITSHQPQLAVSCTSCYKNLLWYVTMPFNHIYRLIIVTITLCLMYCKNKYKKGML